MKEKFKGYYQLNESEFTELWKQSTFVFDTNVLLNLYRYQSTTRDALLDVLGRLKGRAWIPNHVGLEYQRNRLSVIAEQHKRYSEVRDIVSKSISKMQNELEALQLKKRHSHIDPDTLVSSINVTKDTFLAELSQLEQKSISVNSEDDIRKRIEKLFEGNVGEPFSDQKELDDLFKEGELRYNNGIPPGFKDSNKEKDELDAFSYGGLLYKRKYGDLIVWKQIEEYAKSTQLKNLIFVTDDSKSDWWWKMKNGGSQTIGARPELVEEIYREAGVESFYIYNTESFLSYANKQLDAQIAEHAIEEVRAVNVARKNIHRHPSLMRRGTESLENSVYEWLSNYFDEIEKDRRGFPSFIAYKENQKYGFEVRLVREPRFIMHRLDEIIYKAYYALNEDSFHEVCIFLVVADEEMIPMVVKMVSRRIPEFEVNLRIMVGLAEYDEESGIYSQFKPYDNISITNKM
jgi:hypothetical protein